jgi:ABC-2 type transport system ATP-binding protein
MEETVIQVSGVRKLFKLPHEKHTSLKSLFVNMFRRNKGYELQEALDDVSFEVKKGEFFGIVGRNGSGKSTLLKLMAAMYKDIVEFAELKKFMDQKLKNYSSGMHVRLAFSIAIRAKSDILLIDEVLAVGDAAFQQKCFNYFEELRQQKKTVVFVSHDMSAVRRFCDRAIYIKDGKLIYEGTPAEVADIYTEENIARSNEASAAQPEPSEAGSSLKLSVKDDKDGKFKFEFAYKSDYQDAMYVGLSLLKEGQSVAEITTPLEMPLIKKGKVTYDFDPANINGGVYQLTAVLCKQAGRELLCVAKARPQLLIKGEDISRGGALKLEDTWKLASD